MPAPRIWFGEDFLSLFYSVTLSGPRPPWFSLSLSSPLFVTCILLIRTLLDFMIRMLLIAKSELGVGVLLWGVGSALLEAALTV